MDTDAQTIPATPVFSSETFSKTSIVFSGQKGMSVQRYSIDPRRAGAARCAPLRSRAGSTLVVRRVKRCLGCTMLLLFGWQFSAFLSGNQHARWRLLCNGGKTWLFFGIASLNFAIHYPGDWASLPFVQGDASNIASFAAALEQPELFHYDKLLGNPHHFDWYTPGFIWIVRLTARAGFHYTTTFAFVGFVATWMALLGYDRLLTFPSGSRLFGLLASVGLWLFDRSYPSLENWSFFTMLPRSLLSACLPYLILATIHFVRRPGRWWIPAVLAASTFYIPRSVLRPGSGPCSAALDAARVPFVPRGMPRRAPGSPRRHVAVCVTYVAKYRGTVNVDAAVAARS